MVSPLCHNAVHRLALSQGEHTAMTYQCEKFASFHDKMRSRKDLDVTRRRRDEVRVTRVIETIDDRLDPFFTYHEELLNLFTGVIASEQCENDLVKAHEIGEEAAEKFTGKITDDHSTLR